MSDPREAQRERDRHERFVARGELAAAFRGVPDGSPTTTASTFRR